MLVIKKIHLLSLVSLISLSSLSYGVFRDRLPGESQDDYDMAHALHLSTESYEKERPNVAQAASSFENSRTSNRISVNLTVNIERRLEQICNVARSMSADEKLFIDYPVLRLKERYEDMYKNLMQTRNPGQTRFRQLAETENILTYAYAKWSINEAKENSRVLTRLSEELQEEHAAYQQKVSQRIQQEEERNRPENMRQRDELLLTFEGREKVLSVILQNVNRSQISSYLIEDLNACEFAIQGNEISYAPFQTNSRPSQDKITKKIKELREKNNHAIRAEQAEQEREAIRKRDEAASRYDNPGYNNPNNPWPAGYNPWWS